MYCPSAGRTEVQRGSVNSLWTHSWLTRCYFLCPVYSHGKQRMGNFHFIAWPLLFFCWGDRLKEMVQNLAAASVTAGHYCEMQTLQSFCLGSFISLVRGSPWEALGWVVLWALPPASSTSWYLTDHPDQKRSEREKKCTKMLPFEAAERNLLQRLLCYF